MFMNNSSVPTDESKQHFSVVLLLLAGLLFLRFPFLITANLLLTKELAIPRTIVLITFSIATYLIMAVLIWWERAHLRDFWVDLAAAITCLFQIFCFPIGIGLFMVMRRCQAKFPSPPANVWHWALLGAMVALICEISIVNLGIDPPSSRGSHPASFSFLLPAIFTQMTWAAVFEEPLFRGFLWGYLRRIRWKDGWIWLFQALLFTLGHVYYLQAEAIAPWFVRMMLPSLIIGFIAWRAKSIFASMVTHGMFNASHDMLAHTRSLAEAVKVGWTAAVIILVMLVGIWISGWMRHRQVPAT